MGKNEKVKKIKTSISFTDSVIISLRVHTTKNRDLNLSEIVDNLVKDYLEKNNLMLEDI